MRFWFVHSSDVPLHEQIVTQVSLGILSGELGPGERLPSIRELARRFSIHPNTVSLGYRRLEREHWVEVRRGSGVYVRSSSPETRELSPEATRSEYVDRLVTKLVETVLRLGTDADELCRRVSLAARKGPLTKLLLIEPDAELRRIVMAELEAELDLELVASGSYPPELGTMSAGEVRETMVLVLPSKAEAVRSALHSSAAMHVLRVRSVPQSLEMWLPARTEAMVGVASHWAPFLDFARTMLVAAGFQSDALLLRDAREAGWSDGLEESDAVICDAYTARLVPKHRRVILFHLLADDCVAELRLSAGLAKMGPERV